MLSNARRSTAGGFTLVEVMMAAGIMVLAIAGMIQVVISGSEMLDISRKQTIAMQIIHGQLDNIRLSSWTQMGTLSSGTTVDVDGGDQSGFVFGTTLPTVSKGFHCTRTITDVRT